MSIKKYYKHLSLSDRTLIENELYKGTSRSEIARLLFKDKSTICKEVKLRKQIKINNYGGGNYVSDCSSTDLCGLKFCDKKCVDFKLSFCNRRDRSVGVCNGCSEYSTCRRTKYRYSAEAAHKEYKYNLVDAREGFNLTSSQAKELGDLLKPLIDNGQSIYAIKQNHPEILYSEKTIYNYITSGVFSQSGLYDIDLRLKTSRKQPKNNIRSKPRVNRSYLKGRTYDDYLKYIAKHPSYSVVEMDTVYNDNSNGPIIQTMMIVEYGILIGALHNKNNTISMLEGLKLIKSRIGDELFKKIFRIILTDRGAEFSDPESLEALGCKVFYCDPQRPDQKPHVENSHIMLRWILPNGKDLYSLGLETQEDLDLVLSHLNSYPRNENNGRTAFEIFEFFFPDNLEVLDNLRIKKVDKDSVILTPRLLNTK